MAAPASTDASGLMRKLGTRPGERLVLVGDGGGFAGLLPESVEVVQEPAVGGGAEPAELIVAFVASASELPALGGLAPRIRPNGALWVAWPRRAAGHVSDVTDNTVRAALLSTGLVDVKVAALGEDWSGLRFVWRKELRGAADDGRGARSPRARRG